KFAPPPVVKVDKPPEIVVPKPEEQQPDETREDKRLVKETTAPPVPDAPPDRKLAAPAVGAISSTAATAETTWENKARAQLERNKRYPRECRYRHEEDVVYVRFMLNRKGEVLSSSIVRSQGFALLDGEVQALLRRAAPLPAPPPEVQGEQIEMLVPV